MIVIVDYGVGNRGSVLNMLRKLGAAAIVSSRAEDIARASKLIVPGVGAFDDGIARLHDTGLVSIMSERVIGEEVPTLGICLGMQLFTKRSEEGTLPGLGWVDAETVRFAFDDDSRELKIPHMGWNWVVPRRGEPLFDGFTDVPRFYFVHSYHVVCAGDDQSVGVTRYGYAFTSVLRYRNLIGTQFHPEKSHRFGLRLLANFAR